MTMTAPPTVSTSRRSWLALAVVLLAAFMDMLDVGIVTVALPTIQHDLGATYAAGQWFVVAYALAFAVVLITGGRLGDRFGLRRIFLIGVAGFTAMSAVCALAWSPETLIAGRLIQGAFGALMVPQVLALLQVLFPAQRRAVAFIAYGLVLNLAQFGGPILGGVLSTYDLFGLGWRMIFLINVPIGILLVIGTVLFIRESESGRSLRFDLLGAVLIAVLSALIVYPLQQGREQDWPAWMIVALLAAAPVLVLFAIHQHRRGDQAAIVPTSLFRQRSFTAGTLLMLLAFSGITSAFVLITWNVQIALDWSPLRTGLGMSGWVVGIFLVGPVAVNKAHAFGRRLVAIGCGTIAAGMALLSLLIGYRGAELGAWELFLVMLVIGCGMGFVVPILVNVVLVDVPARNAGAGAGVANAVIQFAGAAGVGIVALIFFGFIARGAEPAADRVAEDIRSALPASAVPVSEQDRIVSGAQACLNDRANARDPFQPPETCRTTEATNPVADAAVDRAMTSTFVDATATTLWYQVGVFLLALALTTLLPRPNAPRPGAPQEDQLVASSG